MKTENMLVTLHSSTGKVTYQTLQGNTLLSEKELGTNFTPRKDVTRDAFTVSQAFALQPEEAIYGLGQRQSGAMNHRNQQVHLSNGNTNICIPYFTSEKDMEYTGTIRESLSSAILRMKLHSRRKWVNVPTITSCTKTEHKME